jgi:flagellar protein FliS
MANNYQNTSISTSSKLDLVILCYDKIIEFLAQTKIHNEDMDFVKKGRAFSTAISLISELQSCLNFEKGGEIASNLDSIYSYLTQRLLKGDIERNSHVYDEGIRIIGELKEAWEHIATVDDDPVDNIIVQDQKRPVLGQIAA